MTPSSPAAFSRVMPAWSSQRESLVSRLRGLPTGRCATGTLFASGAACVNCDSRREKDASALAKNRFTIILRCMDAHPEGARAAGLPSILTVEEVANLMRIDRKTAYAAIACGEVPGVRRIGRCIRVSRDVLLRWLETKPATRGCQ